MTPLPMPVSPRLPRPPPKSSPRPSPPPPGGAAAVICCCQLVPDAPLPPLPAKRSTKSPPARPPPPKSPPPTLWEAIPPPVPKSLVCLELSPTVRMSWRNASVSLSVSVDQGLDDAEDCPCFGPPIDEVDDDAEEDELGMKQNQIKV